MRQEFTSLEELGKVFPKTISLLQRENKIQYPNAVLLKAVHGNYHGFPEDPPEYEDDVIAIFDIGDPDKFLYCWVSCVDENEEDIFIDEYYLQAHDWCLQELTEVK